MSLYQRSGVWYYDFWIDSRRYSGSTKRRNKKDAKRVEEEKRRSVLNSSQFVDERDMSLQEVCQEWWENVGQFHRSKDKTQSKLDVLLGRGRKDRRKAKYHLDPEMNIGDLNTMVLTKLKTKRKLEGLGDHSIRHEIGLLRAVWIWTSKNLPDVKLAKAVHWEYKKPKAKRRYLRNAEEEQKLLDALDPTVNRPGMLPYGDRPESVQRELQDNYDLVVMLIDTGMRIDEANRLPWSMVSLSEGYIEVYRWKTEDASILYMTDRLREILSRRYKQRSTPYVFSSKDGGPRKYSIGAIRKAINRAGLNTPELVVRYGRFTPHSLRHTFGSRLAELGVSPLKIKELMDHSHIDTTMAYVHMVRNSGAKDAAKLLNEYRCKIHNKQDS